MVACGATWKKPVFSSRNEDIQSFFRSFRCNLCGRRYIKNYIKKKKNCVDESHGQCSSVLHTIFIFVLITSRRVLYICFNENKTLLTKKVHYEVNCGWFLCALSIKMPLTKRKIKLNFNLNITDSIYTTFHFKLYSWSLKIKLKFEKGIMSVSLVQRQWLVFFRKESVTSLAFSTSFRKMSLVSIFLFLLIVSLILKYMCWIAERVQGNDEIAARNWDVIVLNFTNSYTIYLRSFWSVLDEPLNKQKNSNCKRKVRAT